MPFCRAVLTFRGQFTVALKEEVKGDFACRRYRRYLVVSWAVALLCASFAAIDGDFASAGGWCWVVNRFNLTQVLVAYVPLFGVLVFCVVQYARISVSRSHEHACTPGWH